MKPLNQKTIANKVGISGAFLSFLVSGKRRPSWKTAKKLAEATDTEIKLWMEGSPDEIRSAIFNEAV